MFCCGKWQADVCCFIIIFIICSQRKFDLYCCGNDACHVYLSRPVGKGASQVLQIECAFRVALWEFYLLFDAVLFDEGDRNVCVGHYQSSFKGCRLEEIM